MTLHRTRIKICGITNIEDAWAAVSAGADALGFILVPGTPRCVTTSEFQPILSALPPFIQAVAVVKGLNVDFALAKEHFQAVQYYESTDNPVPAGTLRFIRAFRVRDAHSLQEIEDACARSLPNAILLDAYHKDKLGGSGETFNWELAVDARERFGLPIILAGGLTPENVEEAVCRVRPYAVDVSSGTEAEPGRKDHAKIRAFVEAVQRADGQIAAGCQV